MALTGDQQLQPSELSDGKSLHESTASLKLQESATPSPSTETELLAILNPNFLSASSFEPAGFVAVGKDDRISISKIFQSQLGVDPLKPIEVTPTEQRISISLSLRQSSPLTSKITSGEESVNVSNTEPIRHSEPNLSLPRPKNSVEKFKSTIQDSVEKFKNSIHDSVEKLKGSIHESVTYESQRFSFAKDTDEYQTTATQLKLIEQLKNEAATPHDQLMTENTDLAVPSTNNKPQSPASITNNPRQSPGSLSIELAQTPDSNYKELTLPSTDSKSDLPNQKPKPDCAVIKSPSKTKPINVVVIPLNDLVQNDSKSKGKNFAWISDDPTRESPLSIDAITSATSVVPRAITSTPIRSISSPTEYIEGDADEKKPRNSIKHVFRMKGDGEVLVGTPVMEGHANYMLMYDMLTGIRISVSRCNAKPTREMEPSDFTAAHKLAFDAYNLT